MRVVLDTNVIISALFWGGILEEALKKARKENILCFTEATLNELKATFDYPKFIPHIQKLTFTLEEFLERLTENALILPTPKERVSVIKKHPADNKFLDCALAAQANVIVSGNKHLLTLKEFQGVPIITPREFLKKFK